MFGTIHWRIVYEEYKLVHLSIRTIERLHGNNLLASTEGYMNVATTAFYQSINSCQSAATHLSVAQMRRCS